ncbi:NAD(P)H-hydrate dehydratase [Alicyclobacillus sp. TC]|uniref:NAD(P)H-hydrate dehydratase n=1 Tax=Alicyclobacillus sp. TC TaxID=2606450 RepID=UPI001933A7F2|nr:NAD(P)H-hydrate dehydratase [Alicyclobacillus sp. TC]QRF24316.1 NAD(P)H-hydrate dehydratase [Alicyclobacillus sp. TC]
MYLVTSEQMRELDRHAVTSLHIPEIVLLHLAGKAIADVLVQRGPRGHIVVLAGKGNNGGDGYAAARWLKHYQYSVEVVSLVHPETLTGSVALAAQSAIAAGVPVRVYSGQPLPEAQLYLDALLGTGQNRPPADRLLQMLESLAHTSTPVWAVDVPTGVDTDTGAVYPGAVQAVLTIAMAAQKIGTAVTPGCLQAGEVVVADIGIPILHNPSFATWIEPAELAARAAYRPVTAHKGLAGHVAVIVGCLPGAAKLAALAAARSGAGRISLLTASAIEPPLPDMLMIPVNGALRNSLPEGAVFLMGPGMLDAWPIEVVWSVVESGGKVVLDAEAMDAWLSAPEERRLADPFLAERVVLTPHPKECARLIGWTVDSVQKHRLAAARRLSQQANATVLLKGYRSIVNSQQSVSVNPVGGPSLAVAGSGDVLAGVIAALLAQGLSAYDAARLGCWLHGRAGDRLARRIPAAACMASDVVQELPQALADALGVKMKSTDK